jgi:hypothetical protein
MISRGVELPHQQDLGAALDEIILIDADLIYPQDAGSEASA